jgi:hypothetical protein
VSPTCRSEASTHAVPLRSFVAWTSPRPSALGDLRDVTGATLLIGRAGALTFAFQPRSSHLGLRNVQDFYLGDGADIDAQDFLRNAAGGVPIRVNATGRLLLATSIVGLPPVFLYQRSGLIAITSDVHLLHFVPGATLELDALSAVELGKLGHPIEHRTLFRNLVLVPSGTLVTLDAQAQRISVQSSWDLPETEPLPWPQFIEAQVAAFSEAISRVDLGGTFLSLTAGLDTRCVFSSLAAQHRLVPAATMSGPHLSVDALIAKRLCRAYGIDHHLIEIGSAFTTDLARYVETASLLSGGLASLDQAPEVYLYEQLGSRFRRRLSGNLGNQVGRGGTEGVSLRGAHLGIVGPRFSEAAGYVQARKGHWLLGQLKSSLRARLQFILKHEIVLRLASNYTVGSHFAAQQTPYATRTIIETLAMRPRDDAGAPSSNKLRMRLRDVSHRFFGEPAPRSFQLQLIRQAGGFAARCPVNWGWRPTGGLSLPAFSRGVAALFGMYARATGLDSGLFPSSALLERLAQFHDFRNARRWLRTALREYTLDTLNSRAVRDSDLFDWLALQRVLHEHFCGRKDHYQTVVYALDLALASRLFTGRNAGGTSVSVPWLGHANIPVGTESTTVPN